MATLEDARMPRLRDKNLAQTEVAKDSESFLVKVGKRLKAKKKK